MNGSPPVFSNTGVLYISSMETSITALNKVSVKIEELRVGNWIYLMHGSLGYKLHRVSPTLLFKNAKVTERLIFSKPIPITTEILEKAGFEVREQKNWYFKKPNAQSQTMELFIDDSGCHYADGAFSPELTYLHQLQNLYFSLVGEELQISL